MEKRKEKKPKQTELEKEYFSVFKNTTKNLYEASDENSLLELPTIYEDTPTVSVFGIGEKALTF